MIKKEIATFANNKFFNKVLDIGCGNKPYQDLFKYTQYIGIDIEHSGRDLANKKADIFYNGINIPFEDNTFDLALCNQVLEHAKEPIELLKEINRILKPNGTLILTVPFIWPLHEVPYDHYRFTEFGLNYNLEKLGFKIIEFKKIGTNLDAIKIILESEINKENYNYKKIKLIILRLFVKSLKFLMKEYNSNRIYLDNYYVCKKP